MRRIVLDPGLHALAFSPALSGLMHRIMGPGAFCYPLKIPRVVYPSSFVPAHPGHFVHKDFRATQDMFTCWVPLGNVPTSLGGLAVLPGSQCTPPHRASAASSGSSPDGARADFEAGDVVILHCMTTHASLPNLEPRLRFSAEFRWQLADQPAPRRMVLGPLGTELGARVFRHAPWWRPVPPGLELVDDDAEGWSARLPVPASRFVPAAHPGRAFRLARPGGPVQPECNPSTPAMTREGRTLSRMTHAQSRREEPVPVESAGSLPELKPWREAGWIFRDGDCIAIERQGDETRVRIPADR